jgi:hypothetical protein
MLAKQQGHIETKLRPFNSVARKELYGKEENNAAMLNGAAAEPYAATQAIRPSAASWRTIRFAAYGGATTRFAAYGGARIIG